MNIENCETGQDYEIDDVFVNAHENLVIVSKGRPIFSIPPMQAIELSNAIKLAVKDHNDHLAEFIAQAL